MTTNPIKHVSAALGAAGIVTLGAALLGIFADQATAQQPAAAPVETTPAVPPAPAPVDTASSSTSPRKAMLSLTEIEKRVNAQGVQVTEIEVRGNVVKVEGRDASNREVDLLVDRRSGEILSRELDD